MNIKSVIYITLFISLISCSSDSIILKELPGRFAPEISLLISRQEVIFSASLTASDRDNEAHKFIQSVDSIYFIVLDGKTVVIERKSGTPQISGLALNGGGASVTMNIIWKYSLKDLKELENTTTRLKIFTKDGQFYYDKSTNEIVINKNNEIALSLIPFFTKNISGGYSLGVEAYRNYTVEGDYIPDSQTLIVRIVSSDGRLIWDSSAGRNFMQMIMKVLPENVGEKHKYELLWNGKDLNGNIPKPGNYTISFVIPAKPESYSTTLDIEWK